MISLYPLLQLKKALLGPKRLPSEAVYHVSYAQEPTNTYIRIYRRGNESLLYIYYVYYMLVLALAMHSLMLSLSSFNHYINVNCLGWQSYKGGTETKRKR